MGAAHGRAAAHQPRAPHATPRRPVARVSAGRHIHSQHASATKSAPPPRPSVDKPLESLEKSDAALFSACLRRDAWIDAIVSTPDTHWHAERSLSSLKGSRAQQLEKLAIHRVGLQVVAVVIASPHAEVGDVMWTVDARERTITSFGQPGWGGRLLGEDCVLLVDESAEGRTVLYFYSGPLCRLRCWRFAHGPPQAAHRPRGATDEREMLRRASKESSRSHGRQRKRSRANEGGPSAAAAAAPPQPQPPPSQCQRPRSTDDRQRRRRASDEASTSPKTASSSGASAATAVASWARGEDLAALLSGLALAFGGTLACVRELPQHDAATLRCQPQLLRRMYRLALLACHPDKHGGSSPQDRTLALELFHALSAARAAAAANEAGSQMAC